MQNPFTAGNQAKIRQWIFGILDDLPTTGQVGFGMDTNGNSVVIEEHAGGAEDVEIGTFDDGWITQPARSAECPNCDGKQPALVHGNQGAETIVIDCLNCRTRLAVKV
jgi:hypothetical protein